ncbi:4-hydroxy-3-methylbut-2-enyl diphosphate reductase [Fervidibacter sacchari]|uniref:4-hydroxy-3-methylbut-2-enyl diphosphate reductase n=1 Tax=Candidatus Fervidibacter sacchari TaxID=1448929 RepID=A0ABT2ESR2_9BACT|nr:4-hydroxy-3-methylbut-2-enyl diphosphate reductase [Candidatus Fervidibacter sacchari]MCS3921004.1 4-hydroxy-3-methylbut-2-enyl diphosphate reductase [Candidatus Fervidibacter sacchari]WKU14945.1 4-hydroxy-3-methylbut-2-enyl diphosphate reductase [Candidatus Fervidibacter sacchari]
MKLPKLKKVVLAAPRGFCAGVVRAIEIVNTVLQLLPPPIYVRKEIVHNRFVVERLKQRGVIFVNELDEVPDGATVIFSAHGVSPTVREMARRKNLRVIDATCPLVTKVHLEAIRFAQQGYSIILIGHEGHEEVEGTMGEAPHCTYLVQSVEDVERLQVPNPEKVAYLTQTTLSVDDTAEIVAALKRKFPKIVGPRTDDICYATQNRQNAVKALAKQVDVILVIGSQNSSNSQRLKEVAISNGCPAYLIDGADHIRTEWLIDAESVGVTSGASAPEILVKQVIQRLQELGATEVVEFRLTEERVQFAPPPELRELLEQNPLVDEILPVR